MISFQLSGISLKTFSDLEALTNEEPEPVKGLI
jgi:hypothetical protein